MRIAATRIAAVLALSGASLAQESADAPRSGLARYRDVLNRVEERTADRSYVVADDDLARIAREIEQAIHVPPSWHVVLRQDDSHGFVEDQVHTRITTPNELLVTRLSDRSNRNLSLTLTLDAQWVLIGWAPFLGPDGATDFTRAQFRNRTDFFPLHAIPIVLDSLESELDALPLAQWNLKSLALESAMPLGDSPSVRCALSLEDKAPVQRTAIELNGVISLPPTAAHEKDFRFAGGQGFGDSVIGPVTSTRTLGQCFREARAMSDAIHSGGEWYAHVYHNNGSGSFTTNVIDVRHRRPETRGADFRIESTGFVGTTDEISASVAGVPLTPDGLRQVLKSLAAAYDTEEQYVFLVLGCADRHEILVLFTSAGGLTPSASDLKSLRLVFDASGSKIERAEHPVVRDIQRASEDWHTRWTCRFGDDRVVHVWVHKPVLCGTGEDLTSRARIGDTEYQVAGGLAESALRGD